MSALNFKNHQDFCLFSYLFLVEARAEKNIYKKKQNKKRHQIKLKNKCLIYNIISTEIMTIL